MAVPKIPVTDDSVYDEPTVDPRDDFLEKTKIELLIRAANLCSRCKVFTVGSTHAGNRKNSIGVAAHICAAASGRGAKRYDPDQSKAERKHYDNGIWMCYSCSKLIDNEEILHTVAFLKDMKARHEVYASKWVGVVPMAPFEADNHIRAGIIQASVFLATRQGSPANFDISAVVEGYEEAINALDPNFRVVVTSTSKHVQHEIIPNGKAIPDVKMVFSRANYEGVANAWKTMVETGGDLKLTTEQFQFRGSPLFESLNEVSPNTQLIISRVKKKFDTTVYFVAGSERFELGSGDAYVTDGTKKIEIEGVVLDGFFTYKYSGVVDAGLETSFSYHQSAWLGQPFNNIKNYHRIKKAYDFLMVHPNAAIDVEVHAYGSTLSMGVSPKTEYSVFHERFKFIIELAEILISVSRKVNKRLCFKTVEIGVQDIDLLLACSLVIDGPVGFKLNAGSYICDVPVAIDDKLKFDTLQSEDSDEPLHMTISPLVNLYGNWISFPKLTRTYSAYDVAYTSRLDDHGSNTIICVISANDKTEFCSYFDPDGVYLLNDESELGVIEVKE